MSERAHIPWPPGFPCLWCAAAIDEREPFAVMEQPRGTIVGAVHIGECVDRARGVPVRELPGLAYYLDSGTNYGEAFGRGPVG